MAIKISFLLSLSLLLVTSAYSFSLKGALANLPKLRTTIDANTIKKWEKLPDRIDHASDLLELVLPDNKPAPPRVPTTGLVKNGGFEFNQAGWKIFSPKAVKVIDAKHFKVPSGSSAVELIGGRQSLLTQVIKTVPNKEYKLSFIIGDAKNGCHGNMLVGAGTPNAFQVFKFKSVGAGHNKEFSLSFKAVGISTRLFFLSASYHRKITDRTLCGPVIDEVKVFSK